jgi:hypothetical protein
MVDFQQAMLLDGSSDFRPFNGFSGQEIPKNKSNHKSSVLFEVVVFWFVYNPLNLVKHII